MKKKQIIYPILSLLSGIALVAAYAPINAFFIAIIATTLLLYCLNSASPHQAFWRGVLFGTGLFGAGVYWVYNSIHTFGNLDSLKSGIITAVFVILLSLYTGIQGYVYRKLFDKKSLLKQSLLAFPLTWVIFEGLRSWLFSGFPWLLIGYTQTETILSGYAPIFSVFGVSLVVCLISGAAFVLTHKTTHKRDKIIAASVAGSLIVVAIPLHFAHWTTSDKKPLPVALVQGNIPQKIKWLPEYRQYIIDQYLLLTEKNWHQKIIIWPESAMPTLKSEVETVIKMLDKRATKHQAAVIFGTLTEQDQKIYNTIMAVGNGTGVYNKHHLVPFGEYTPKIFKPLMQRFNIQMSDLAEGPLKQKPLIIQDTNIAPFICYEVAYPYQVAYNSRGTQALIVISDDSWFGKSFASAQQVQMAKMRAIETARPILYVNNTSDTTVIQPNGRANKIAPKNKRYVVTGKFFPVHHNTPFMDYYFYPLAVVLVVLLTLSLI